MTENKGDLISREALKKSFEETVCIEPMPYAFVKQIIDNAPTVDIPNYGGQVVPDTLQGWRYEERPQGEWIPVSERLPDDLEPVNITWINHEPEPYYKEIKGKPFTATGVYFNGQWYWWSTLCTDMLAEYSNNYNDIIDTAIEVIAWQQLPEPYKKGGVE